MFGVCPAPQQGQSGKAGSVTLRAGVPSRTRTPREHPLQALVSRSAERQAGAVWGLQSSDGKTCGWKALGGEVCTGWNSRGDAGRGRDSSDEAPRESNSIPVPSAISPSLSSLPLRPRCPRLSSPTSEEGAGSALSSTRQLENPHVALSPRERNLQTPSCDRPLGQGMGECGPGRSVNWWCGAGVENRVQHRGLLRRPAPGASTSSVPNGTCSQFAHLPRDPLCSQADPGSRRGPSHATYGWMMNDAPKRSVQVLPGELRKGPDLEEGLCR